MPKNDVGNPNREDRDTGHPVGREWEAIKHQPIGGSERESNRQSNQKLLIRDALSSDLVTDAESVNEIEHVNHLEEPPNKKKAKQRGHDWPEAVAKSLFKSRIEMSVFQKEKEHGADHRAKSSADWGDICDYCTKR